MLDFLTELEYKIDEGKDILPKELYNQLLGLVADAKIKILIDKEESDENE